MLFIYKNYFLSMASRTLPVVRLLAEIGPMPQPFAVSNGRDGAQASLVGNPYCNVFIHPSQPLRWSARETEQGDFCRMCHGCLLLMCAKAAMNDLQCALQTTGGRLQHNGRYRAGERVPR